MRLSRRIRPGALAEEPSDQECDRIPHNASGSGHTEVDAGADGVPGAGGTRVCLTTACARETHPRRLLSRGGARLVFLIPGAFALFAGLDAALLLVGLPAPVTAERLPIVHGPLLVFGFVGTVIALERAVAVRAVAAFAAPALLGLGGIVLVTPLPLAVGEALLAAGMAALLGVYAAIWRRQRMLAVAVQALGAWLALAAVALWLGGLPASALVPGMTGFLVLTIAGERIELARLVVLSARAEAAVAAAAGALAVGVLAAMLWPEPGHRLFGAALIALLAWLSRFDVATRLVTGSRGLPRYVAACLLAGYFWLLVAALIWLFVGPVTSGPWYDGAVHSVFLGFTIGMIMAHAPIILPAVLRRPLPYRPMLIVPVMLLNVSLVVRVLVGDTQNLPVAVQLGGALGVAALLLFVALAAFCVITGRRARPASVRTAVKP